jgi:hypothetical protein
MKYMPHLSARITVNSHGQKRIRTNPMELERSRFASARFPNAGKLSEGKVTQVSDGKVNTWR